MCPFREYSRNSKNVPGIPSMYVLPLYASLPQHEQVNLKVSPNSCFLRDLYIVSLQPKIHESLQTQVCGHTAVTATPIFSSSTKDESFPAFQPQSPKSGSSHQHSRSISNHQWNRLWWADQHRCLENVHIMPTDVFLFKQWSTAALWSSTFSILRRAQTP